jgi:hypothetical protein
VSDYINMKDMQLQEYLLDYEDYKEGVIRQVDLDQKSSKLKNVLLTEQKLYQTEVDQFDPYDDKQMGRFLLEADREITTTHNHERSIFVCPKQQAYDSRKLGRNRSEDKEQHGRHLPVRRMQNSQSSSGLEIRGEIGKGGEPKLASKGSDKTEPKGREGGKLRERKQEEGQHRIDSSDDESMTSQTEAKLDMYYRSTQELQNRVMEHHYNPSEKNLFSKTLKSLIKIEEYTASINEANKRKLESFKIV